MPGKPLRFTFSATRFLSSVFLFVVGAFLVLSATGFSCAEENPSTVGATPVPRPIAVLRIADFQRVFDELEDYGSKVMENAGPFARQWLEWKLFPAPLDNAWLGTADAWVCLFEAPNAPPQAGGLFQNFSLSFGWAIPVKDAERPLDALSELFGLARKEPDAIFVFSLPQEPGKKPQELWLRAETDRILLASSSSHLTALRAWFANQPPAKPEGDLEIRIPAAPWRNRYGAAFALAALLTPGQAARFVPVEQDAVKNACTAIFKRLLDAHELRLLLTLPSTPDAPAALKLQLLPHPNEIANDAKPALKRRTKWAPMRFISRDTIASAALPLESFLGLEPTAFLPWLTFNSGQKEAKISVVGRRSPNAPALGTDDWEKILESLTQRGRTNRQSLCSLFSLSPTKNSAFSRFSYGFEASFSETHGSFLTDNVFPALAFLGIGENNLRSGRFGFTADYWFLGMGPDAETEVKGLAERAETDCALLLPKQGDASCATQLKRLFDLFPNEADVLLLLRPLKGLKYLIERAWPDDLLRNETFFQDLNEAPLGLSVRLDHAWELELLIPAQAAGNLLRFHWRLLKHEKFWMELLSP
jgi:hypothetical protein